MGERIARATGNRPVAEHDLVVHNATLLILVIVVAVSFDFTNGFHDTANAMATSIATGAL